MFSMRDYSAFKCLLDSEIIVRTLVTFYNAIIKCNYCPSRCSKVVDMMIEKGKGPRLGKLRMLEMIEVDMQLIMRVFLVEG